MVKEILEALFPNDKVDAYYIWENFRRGFAILLSINQGNMVRNFIRYGQLTDHSLPFTDGALEHFPTSDSVDLFKDFSRRQWRYFPLEMSYMMSGPIPHDAILPFRVRERLSRSQSATVNKIEVDQDYNKLAHPVSEDSLT